MANIKEQKITLPEGVSASFENDILTVKGPEGEVSRLFKVPLLVLNIEGNTISLTTKRDGKRSKTLLNTWNAHIKNMVRGVTQGHEYELKICSGHFPMSVSLKGNQLEVKNFLGEKVPRVLTLKEGAQVKVDGDKIYVKSVDIERAGQVAADIEKLTRITNRDIRIFQDGIYIIKKSGREPFV
ncbi:50S ribosomal protein L6 [Candidatus Woesearchaeota archaeon]|nr:MAG: 50S ribosomal protein L6 [Candidatus Woesearchaeota archaeon]